MDFVKLSEQRFTAKKFDVNKKIPRDDVGMSGMRCTENS